MGVTNGKYAKYYFSLFSVRPSSHRAKNMKCNPPQLGGNHQNTLKKWSKTPQNRSFLAKNTKNSTFSPFFTNCNIAF
jgi:hypothetical protein